LPARTHCAIPMYRLHKVYCANPWELEAERRAFYDVVGEFNERDAMNAGILLRPYRAW